MDDSAETRGDGRKELGRRALEHLTSALSEAGLECGRARNAGRAGMDLLVRHPEGASWAVALKVWGARAGQDLMRAFLADAILCARSSADAVGGRPLAVVAAPRFSPAMAKSLRAYVDSVAPGVAWGMIDDAGIVELHGPGLEGVVSAPLSRSRRARGAADQREIHNPFSDLGQWMLKVLLAPRIPPDLLSAPRDPIRGVQDLVRAADVSLASASKFVSSMRNQGLLDIVDGVLRPVRLEALFERWRAAVRKEHLVQHASFHFPSSDPAGRVASALAALDGELGAGAPRSCLARSSACKRLGLGWARGVEPDWIWSEDLSPAHLERMGLHVVEPGTGSRPDVVVLSPLFPESLFRGLVRPNGVPVADVLQCWLDVRDFGARGEEQAEEILNRLNLHG